MKVGEMVPGVEAGTETGILGVEEGQTHVVTTLPITRIHYRLVTEGSGVAGITDADDIIDILGILALARNTGILVTTVVNGFRTLGAGIAGVAFAEVALEEVETVSGDTGIGRAVVDEGLAPVPRPSGSTRTVS